MNASKPSRWVLIAPAGTLTYKKNMALYRITVKRSLNSNGVDLEKGMSVEVASSSDPVSMSGGKLVQDAFERIYGIDIKKAGAINHSVLDVAKVN